MKRRAVTPQYEFRWGAEDFKLITESTLDGDRIRQEQQQKEQQQKEAASKQVPLFEEVK